MAHIIVDTREKDNSYILQDFKLYGYDYSVETMTEGDYCSSDNPNFVIDLKNGILEVQGNIAGNEKQRARFTNEILRCIEKGKTLMVLIRDPKIYTINGVQYWKSPKNRKTGKPFTKVSGKFIMAVMKSYSEKFGVIWKFCTPEETAGRIIYFLNRNGGNLTKCKNR